MSSLQESIRIEKLTLADCRPDLLRDFSRHQEVSRCWRKTGGEWRLADIRFTESWDDNDKAAVVQEMRCVLRAGGAVFCAFERGKAVGFAVVGSAAFGMLKDYVQLVHLHISSRLRRCGLGRALFKSACREARRFGAKKLYISGHSAEESQAFYRAMGCVDATEINEALYAKEPCDRHLEFLL